MTGSKIPTEQMAQVFEKSKAPANWKRIPVKQPADGELLVHVLYSGVCHSDVHAQKTDWPRPPTLPVVGGHEGAGVVVAVGSAVDGFEVGDHVGVKWVNGTCGKCAFCRDGQEQLCPNAALSGYTVDGSFQQYATVQAAASNKIPKECDLAKVAPVMCAGLTVYKGLKTTGCRPGQYVAIVGAGGGLGSYGVQYAKAMGLKIIGIDIGALKGESARKLGAETYIDASTSKDVIADLRAATPDGLGPHGAVIVSGDNEPFTHASDYVRPMGTVAIVGIPSDSYVKSQTWDMVARLVSLRGSLVGNRVDLDEALDFFARGLVDIPQKLVPLSSLNEELNKLDKSDVVGRFVTDNSK